MRKITSESVSAFLSEKEFGSSNTVVSVNIHTTELRLHGNLIASKVNGGKFISISNCGWFSNTTKERLNALPNVFIQQKKGEWFLNGEKWNGKLTEIQL